MNFFNGGEAQAGKEMERELLGMVKTETKEAENENTKIIINKEKVPEFEAALINIENRRIQNPRNPERPFANFLRTKIIDLLSEEIQDEAEENLEYYTAISKDPNQETGLDKHFGVDAFFKLKLEGREKPIYVTFDITLRPGKSTSKANVVFSLTDDFPAHARFEKGQLTGITESEFHLFDNVTDILAEEITKQIEKKFREEF
ncbi:MAG: hypothetical protein WDK96_03615 [Candidatus Paceibacterota bacterium]|jgi:hypothetical protein